MKRILVLFALALLIACQAPAQAVINETPVEEITTIETEPAVEPVAEPVSVAEPVVVIPVVNETEGAPEVNVTNETEDDFFSLSIAEQQRALPGIKEAVRNSRCSSLTWDGIENHSTRFPLSVTSDSRFQYKENNFWKGWITYTLHFSRIELESETIVLTVDDLNVECPDASDFKIDWEQTLLRYTN